ncbi:MAG: DUF5119 domain-containing protein [Prevotellaceae bacterium]|nr:DUF5119 domain-containing protein [Candidatus Minthosoma equi]
MKKFTRLTSLAIIVAAAIAALVSVTSCERVPPLHLHRGLHMRIPLPLVQLNLHLFWSYELGYDWESEWTYGWDEVDQDLFGNIGYTEPNVFDLRRYYTGMLTNALHTTKDEFIVNGRQFITEYDFGYYDMLVYNHIITPDNIQSLWFDEETTLDSVMAFTNMCLMPSSYHAPEYPRSFYQPEEMFAAYERNMYISDNPDDYDGYDPVTNTYIKYMNMTLTPVTYIYLTQVRLHHNNGRIAGVDGNANLSGMAKGVTLNSGLANKEAVAVYYNVRFKQDCVIKQTGEHVDVAGGRCLTFGITNQNSSRTSRAEDVQDNKRHYMDVNFQFSNGNDSTFVFDVTDQVRKRYKGGVITIDLDVDTIKIPSRTGGSGFDAVVKPFDEETHEIEFK